MKGHPGDLDVRNASNIRIFQESKCIPYANRITSVMPGMEKKKLVPGFPVLRKAFLAINWSPFCRFEGHFTFLTTI
jgi:hypothetical protein